MATLFVDKVDPQSGTALEIGSSGDTITIPSGATITNNGTQNGFGGVNTPAFHVTLSSNQALSNTTNTKVTFNNEVYDSDGKFASNKFTPGVVGKYILSVCLMIDGDTNSTVNTTRLFIYKNGSSIQFVETSSAANPGRIHAPSISLLVDSDADDYFEVYAYISTSGSGQFVQGGTAGSFFAGYKIIT